MNLATIEDPVGADMRKNTKMMKTLAPIATEGASKSSAIR
jgi:hypothetical protein